MVIGWVVRPHGRRGDLVVRPQSSEAEGIFCIGDVFFVRDGVTTVMTVNSLRWHKGDVLLKVDGVSDRSTAETYRGCQVEVDREDLQPLDEDTYYEEDLIGCRLITASGDHVGTIDEVLRTGGVDVLIVASDDGRWMMPATREIMVSVDVHEKMIEVSLLEGLRDLKC